MRLVSAPWAIAAAVLAGCASAPTDGPPERIPPGIERTPDAVPRVEPIPAGPNRPYSVAGRSYVPLTRDVPFAESGLASWYGRKFHGRPTSSGEPYDMFAMTAAHRTMPIPSYARVRNPANGREIVVRVNDRGPFVAGRVIDLSYAAAAKLGLLGGVGRVQLRRITHEEMRAGRAPASLASDDPPPAASATALRNDAVAPSADEGSAPPAARTALAGFWLQLAALRDPAAAAALRRQALDESGVPGVLMQEAAGLTRVQAGPYATRAEALAAHRALATRLALDEGDAPLVVERR